MFVVMACYDIGVTNKKERLRLKHRMEGHTWLCFIVESDNILCHYIIYRYTPLNHLRTVLWFSFGLAGYENLWKMFHQDAPSRKSVLTMIKINKLKYKLIKYASYSPHFTTNDYYLFPKLGPSARYISKYTTYLIFMTDCSLTFYDNLS